MKKLFPLSLLIALFITTGAHAAAALPSTAVWFAPTTAAVGTPITLNTLVYNNQSVAATVTVRFSDTTTIATATTTIPAQSADTVTAQWTMPAKNTVVTATVITAVDKNKKTLSALIGTIGSITVGNTPVPLINGTSFPGSIQINGWFGPIFSKIEAWRIKEAGTFTTLRDTAKAKVGVTIVPSGGVGVATKALGNPIDYATLLYASAGVTLFSNQIIFYIVGALLLLFILRWLVSFLF